MEFKITWNRLNVFENVSKQVFWPLAVNVTKTKSKIEMISCNEVINVICDSCFSKRTWKWKWDILKQFNMNFCKTKLINFHMRIETGLIRHKSVDQSVGSKNELWLCFFQKYWNFSNWKSMKAFIIYLLQES